MADLIDRQAAIEAVQEELTEWEHSQLFNIWTTAEVRFLMVEVILKKIPSAEPKTGRWMIRETAYEDTEAKCSECGFVTLVNEPGNGLHMLSDLHFCPNCGAKMGGDAE